MERNKVHNTTSPPNSAITAMVLATTHRAAVHDYLRVMPWYNNFRDFRDGHKCQPPWLDVLKAEVGELVVSRNSDRPGALLQLMMTRNCPATFYLVGQGQLRDAYGTYWDCLQTLTAKPLRASLAGLSNELKTVVERFLLESPAVQVSFAYPGQALQVSPIPEILKLLAMAFECNALEQTLQLLAPDALAAIKSPAWTGPDGEFNHQRSVILKGIESSSARLIAMTVARLQVVRTQAQSLASSYQPSVWSKQAASVTEMFRQLSEPVKTRLCAWIPGFKTPA